MQNNQFWGPDQYRKWDTISHGETAIAACVFHNLPEMYNNEWKRAW